MKNLLTSFFTICVSFCITLFILNQSYKKQPLSINNNIEESNSVEIQNTAEEIDDINIVDYSNILVDLDTWKSYHKENIDLSTEFIALNIDSEEITKKTFLEKLKTGNYIPVKPLNIENTYQLYRINKKSDQKISKAIKTYSNTSYDYLLKENTPFPEFSFEDLTGNIYTSENTKDKILVIQCWFVQCTQCVQEFPIVNDLYDMYESYDNILFLGLAFDDTDKLKKFLVKKELRYASIPNQKEFIKEELNFTQFPTHIIVDENGIIKKMVNDANSLVLALDNIMTDREDTNSNEDIDINENINLEEEF